MTDLHPAYRPVSAREFGSPRALPRKGGCYWNATSRVGRAGLDGSLPRLACSDWAELGADVARFGTPCPFERRPDPLGPCGRWGARPVLARTLGIPPGPRSWATLPNPTASWSEPSPPVRPRGAPDSGIHTCPAPLTASRECLALYAGPGGINRKTFCVRRPSFALTSGARDHALRPSTRGTVGLAFFTRRVSSVRLLPLGPAARPATAPRLFGLLWHALAVFGRRCITHLDLGVWRSG